MAFRDFVMEGWLLQKQLVRPYHMSLLQYVILRSLAKPGRSLPSQLASELGISPPAITVLVAGLEERGWAKRSALRDDRRTVQVTLTPKAKRTLGAIEAHRTAVMRRSLESIPVENRQAFAEMLQGLTLRLRSERVPEPLERASGVRP
jgi:DNA-binding MarR family transcriptional regulator